MKVLKERLAESQKQYKELEQSLKQEKNKAIDSCIEAYKRTKFLYNVRGLRPNEEEVTNALLKLKVEIEPKVDKL